MTLLNTGSAANRSNPAVTSTAHQHDAASFQSVSNRGGIKTWGNYKLAVWCKLSSQGNGCINISQFEEALKIPQFEESLSKAFQSLLPTCFGNWPREEEKGWAFWVVLRTAKLVIVCTTALRVLKLWSQLVVKEGTCLEWLNISAFLTVTVDTVL